MVYLRLMNRAMPDMKLVLRYAQRMQRMTRRMARHIYKLRQYERRELLRHDPNTRRRVHDDLGGKMAMVMWERRRREAKVVQSAAKAGDPYPDAPRPSFDRPAKQYPRKTPCKWKPKTDRFGHYRLAVIKTGKMANKPKRPKPKRKETQVKLQYTMRCLPLEVTPDELRPTHRFSSGYSPPPGGGYPPSGHSPPIDRPPIH